MRENRLGMSKMEAGIYNESTHKVILCKSMDALVKTLKRYGQRGYTATHVRYFKDCDGFMSVGIVKRKDVPKKYYRCVGERITSDTPGYQCIFHSGKLFYHYCLAEDQ